MKSNETLDELNVFLKKAIAHCYAGKGLPVKTPQRPGFIEYQFSDGDWEYRDSFTGWLRSWGSEIVYFQNQPVWVCSYGGGVVDTTPDQVRFIFKLLKDILLQETNQFRSARGPHKVKLGEWRYSYSQTGDLDEFRGLEEIKHQGELKFYHRVLGGLVKQKPKLGF